MPVDIDAAVLSNRRLGADYNVLALRAPEIAERAEPGQFVMVKPDAGLDPLLRRPFSVFEILREESGRATGLSLLNKRIGPTTGRLFAAEPGLIVRCLGPLGRPFVAVQPPAEAWMVAGGVGLAPFATLTEALRARGTSMTLFYGARRAHELHYLEFFEQQGCRLVLATEDGSRGAHGRVTLPLERELEGRGTDRPVTIYACGPEPMLAAVARMAGRFSRPVHVSVERVMGCGLGGCYSCVVPVRSDTGGRHFVRSCIAGPVFRGDEILWD